MEPDNIIELMVGADPGQHDLMFIIYLILCALLCGFGYRIRGGWLQNWHRPGQVSRLIFAGLAGLSLFIASYSWEVSLVSIPLFWVCTTIPLFHSIDLGQNEGSFWSDFFLLVLRGLLAVLPVVGLLWWFDYTKWWVLGVCGLLMGPSYLLAKYIPSNIEGFGAHNDFPGLGEFIFGICIGVGIYLSAS